MTRDDHIDRLLTCLAEGVGLSPENPAFAPLRNILFVLLDRAIAEGVRQERLEIAQSRN